MKLVYGNLPVPQPVMWSEEEEFYVGVCPWFRLPAICQKQAQGRGVPRFGRPHAMRLRKCMLLGLCDICGKPLRTSTKISLSHSPKGKDDPNVQVEPLMHVGCAKLSVKLCPALQEQRKPGMPFPFTARQVFRYDVKPILANPTDMDRYAPDYVGPPLIGLAIIKLISYQDVTSTFF